MATLTAPGVYVTVAAAPPSPAGNTATGTWFVTGQTVQGPTGVAIPITSMTDYANFLGARSGTYSLLFDALDEFFRDGGTLAYVSRVPFSTGAPVAATIVLGGVTLTAAGVGAWGNTLAVAVSTGLTPAGVTIAGTVVLTITLGGVAIVPPSPNLYTTADAAAWAGAISKWLLPVNVTVTSTVMPTVAASAPFATGADGTASVEGDWTTALTTFTNLYGVGQVSAPGHTTAVGYVAINAHAQAFNRVGLLDVTDGPTATTLISYATTFQTAVVAAGQDPSYSALFGPWITLPGISNATPGSSSPVPTRTCAPSALAAATMAKSDRTNNTNVPAAGLNGLSTYAINVTQNFIDSDRGLLNSAGVNVVRNRLNSIMVYGFRSLAIDPNWVYLNNVRFRMQMQSDFGNIAQSFVFQEIDGQGHVFSTLAGAIAGQCQTYFIAGALYGVNPQNAYLVNTGPQVNTPATIAASQINAQVSVRMSPIGEFVPINVSKYAVSAALPSL